MLSLSMIVRDEAEQLEACLASVAGFVDEMVVVDTGSTDATCAIAARCGATVHQLAWPGDFAPARNRALELVHGDWVLVLDADERLCTEARDPLRRLMTDPDLLLINLLRREEGASQAPYSNVSRLFRRHPAIRWSRPYHSMVDDSVVALLQREPHWRIGQYGEAALIHHGYRPELLAASTKAQRLREAMESELHQRPGAPYASAKLAGLELAEGRPDRAIPLLHSGLSHCPSDAHPERFELLLHLAMAEAEDHPDRAVAHYREALALPLERRLSLAAGLTLAGLLLRLQRLDEAATVAEQTCAWAPELALAWFNLGLIQRQRGALPAAITAYRQAVALDPQRPESHQNLGAALLLAGDIVGARQGFREAIDLLQGQNRADEARALAQRAGDLVNLSPP
jgi:tetratricopeptide (TPR) repeat protein